LDINQFLILGGGLDCFLSASRVGPKGKVYGLDVTEAMVELAKINGKEAGVSEVEFLLGNMEAIPLADESVDVVISNCVINLASDKDIVLQEAYRVLKKDGKFAVADIVLNDELPERVRENVTLWTGCIAGALTEKEYGEKLNAAGFEKVEMERIRVYNATDVPPIEI